MCVCVRAKFKRMKGRRRRGFNFEFVVSTKKLEEVSGFACETDKLDFRQRL